MPGLRILPALLPLLVFAFAARPLHALTANPNATPQAKALLQYLISLSGQKILAGQESMFGDGAFPSSRDQFVQQKTGKYPAVYASDFGDVGTGNLADRRKVVSNAISYHKKGSLIAIQYHMIQPDLPDGAGFQAMNIPGSGYSKLNDMLTPGHALHTEFNRRLDELAGYFHTLQDSGVPVLWRPYHEMNGDFFWWSHQDRFKDLWKYSFDYLTMTKKCDNLVWIFSVNWYSAGAAGKFAPDFYYPGHEYVDMLGCDVYVNYGHGFDTRIHDALRKLGGNRPIAITESGTMPDLAAIRAEQPYWVYWLTWWGFEGADKGNTDALYTANYGHPDVLTQDEVGVVSLDTNLRIVRVSVLGSGQVTRVPSGTSVPKGTVASYKAVPATGWEFQGWSGSNTSTNPDLQITVTENLDLIATFKPKAGTVVNLVKNGDFSAGTAGWDALAAFQGAAASGTVQDGRYAVAITNGGSEAWHVQLTQGTIPLETGKTYTLSFDASAPAAKPLYAKVGQSGGTYQEYAGLTVTLGPTVQTYRKTFIMTAASDAGARLEFNIGANTAGFFLDNVALLEGDGANAIRPRLAWDSSRDLEVIQGRDAIQFRSPAGTRTLALYSLEGRLLAEFRGNAGSVARHRLPPGAYLVRLSGRDGARAVRLAVTSR